VFALILLSGAWWFIGPTYSHAVAASGGALTSPQVSVSSDSNQIVILYQGPRESLQLFTVVRGLTLSFGPLLLTALILATLSCPWRRRVATVAVTWAGFFVVHVLAVTLLGWGVLWTQQGGPVTLVGLRPVIPLAYMALPAVVGAAWCLRYWSPVLSVSKQ
jgi:hypothetical protein